MKKLFEPVKLGGLTIKNRLVRSATLEMAAPATGRPPPCWVKFMKTWRRAERG